MTDWNDGLTDRLASIAAQMNTDNVPAIHAAAQNLNDTIQSLPQWVVSADEALTLQALAISIARAIPAHIEDPGAVLGLASQLVAVTRAAASYSEIMSGVGIEERAFFENGRAGKVQ